MKEMRRQDRKLTEKETGDIIRNGEFGVLSMICDDMRPYSIPLNYSYDESRQALYMHCSVEGGQKIDCIRKNPEVCFTIVEKTEPMPEKFATKYWSANVFGKMSIIEEGAEKHHGIECILRKYAPEHFERGLKYIDGAFSKIHVLRLDIIEMTGKARKK